MTGPGLRQTVREAAGFFAVGVAATLTHLCVGLALYYAVDLGLSALAANLAAFCVAYLVSYFGNATLAFPGTKLGPASFFGSLPSPSPRSDSTRRSCSPSSTWPAGRTGRHSPWS